MLRYRRIGWIRALVSGCFLAGDAAVAGESDGLRGSAGARISEVEREEPWRANRRRVEATRRQIEIEVAELHAIAEAQRALVEYVESGGGSDDEGLDRMLCDESALRPLCAELVETFSR